MARDGVDAARYDYVRDDVRRRIRVTVRQPLQPVDTSAIIDRQVRDNTWTWGILYDLRAVHAETPRAQVDALADYVREQVTLHGARGPVAVVTRQSRMIGMAKMYALFGAQVGFSVEVFWDIEDAERWIDEQLRSIT